MDSQLKRQIAQDTRDALAEDIGDGDLCAPLLPQKTVAGQLICREKANDSQSAVLCGVPWFEACFLQCDSAASFDWQKQEGDELIADEVVCTVRGQAAALLSAERSALNFLQTLSATATKSRRWQTLAGDSVCITDTRKTLPKLRAAQKYAVVVGGAHNHRRGLFDEILLKENHIAAGGGIGKVFAAAQKIAPARRIQVEVRDLAELAQALQAGATRILLDNFSVPQLAAAVRQTGGAAELEASGGIDEDTIAEIAATGVDRISSGALTKNILAVEFSFLLHGI